MDPQLTPDPDGAPWAIETERLTRRFGSVVAVKGISLKIRQGVVYGLLGPNGAGKSTTIKMLTTLIKPSAGAALVAGFDIVRAAPDVRRRIGYVPQMISADGALTGYENLLLSTQLYGLPRGERNKRIDEALQFMGIADAAGKLVNTYSGGMIRRLELAQAMLHRPAVLFLDEPTIGLDPVARRTVWDRLRQLRADFGMTILITTHDMEEADALCDELAIMDRGEIAVSGTPQALTAAIGPEATLDDVFVQYAGRNLQESGDYRGIQQARNTAQHLG